MGNVQRTVVISEIEYTNSAGKSVHSDLINGEITNECRNILHTALDEWLDMSNGTGSFYVRGNES